MAKDPDKYKDLRLFDGTIEQDFTISVGSPVFKVPRLKLTWPDGKEVYLYFDHREMFLIHAWSESYLPEEEWKLPRDRRRKPCR